jgi:uncharacterized protein (TIGR02996 family)
MNDLASFLEAIRRTPEDDTARLVFADWLDERYPATPVQLGKLPMGFQAYWSRRLLAHEFAIHTGYRRANARGRWSTADIIQAFTTVIGNGERTYFEGFGATTIGGQPVLVFEPHLDELTTLRLCRELGPIVGRCPVSFSRHTDSLTASGRIGVWFAALPSEKQLLEEAFAAVVKGVPSLAQGGAA